MWTPKEKLVKATEFLKEYNDVTDFITTNRLELNLKALKSAMGKANSDWDDELFKELEHELNRMAGNNAVLLNRLTDENIDKTIIEIMQLNNDRLHYE